MSTTIEKRRETLAELREERIPALEARLEELDGEIADAVANGGDAEALKEERAQVREDLENFETAAPILERRIREAERERLEERAEELLQSVRKRVGGLAGEQPRHVERFDEAMEKARRALEAAVAARAKRAVLARVAELLAAKFDLEKPSLRQVPDPADFDEVVRHLQFRPGNVIEGARLRPSFRANLQRRDPRDQLRQLAGVADDVEAPIEAVELLDRLADLEEDGDPGD